MVSRVRSIAFIFISECVLSSFIIYTQHTPPLLDLFDNNNTVDIYQWKCNPESTGIFKR